MNVNIIKLPFFSADDIAMPSMYYQLSLLSRLIFFFIFDIRSVSKWLFYIVGLKIKMARRIMIFLAGYLRYFLASIKLIQSYPIEFGFQ